MAKKEEKMTVEILLFYCVLYKILTPTEAAHCLSTSELPKDILIRLKQIEIHKKQIEKANKN